MDNLSELNTAGSDYVDDMGLELMDKINELVIGGNSTRNPVHVRNGNLRLDLDPFASTLSDVCNSFDVLIQDLVQSTPIAYTDKNMTFLSYVFTIESYPSYNNHKTSQ